MEKATHFWVAFALKFSTLSLDLRLYHQLPIGIGKITAFQLDPNYLKYSPRI